MIGVHAAVVEFLSRATVPEQTTENTDRNIFRATSLMRLFNEQGEMLLKLKGLSGQQRITVERVDVHAGGKAVVGTLTAGNAGREGGYRGSMSRSERKPHGVKTKPFFGAARCGATRQQTRCGAAAMHNGRCRFHGGLSTGPKTPEGVERIRRVRLKQGWFSAHTMEERRNFRRLVKGCQELLESIGL